MVFFKRFEMHDLVLCTASKIRVVTEGPLPGDFRVIVCPIPPQMNDLLGTPDAPVSKIASVNKAENH